jgi:hypothetical protein
MGLELDFLSFDAFNFFDRLLLYKEAINNFFNRGKNLCWGIIPTQELDSKVLNLEYLVNDFKDKLNRLSYLGPPKEKIIFHSLLTPSCGMGNLEPTVSEGISHLLCELSQRLIKDYS